MLNQPQRRPALINRPLNFPTGNTGHSLDSAEDENHDDSQDRWVEDIPDEHCQLTPRLQQLVICVRKPTTKAHLLVQPKQVFSQKFGSPLPFKRVISPSKASEMGLDLMHEEFLRSPSHPIQSERSYKRLLSHSPDRFESLNDQIREDNQPPLEAARQEI